MDRNVYSLVLSDDIVAAVDKLAYERATSRSNLINQILAEYLSFSTPEMRMKNIFDFVEQTIADIDCFQIQFQPSDAMISIRSALRYRYNPTIRYVLELYRQCEPTVGEVRVSMRTQSRPLIQILTNFFVFWDDMEHRVLPSFSPNCPVESRIDAGRYTRKFLQPPEQERQTDEKIAESIAEYVEFFDRCLKHYFAGLEDLDSVEASLEDSYRQHILTRGIL
jgi:predicted transcriptional regulator